MAKYELKKGNYKVRPERNAELQYALNKVDSDPSLAVKSAARGAIIGQYINREYNRLRSADMAGIRHKHFLNQLADQEAYANKINSLERERLALEKSQTNRAKKGAMIGSMLGLVGIGIGQYHKKQMELDDARLRDIQAGIIESDAAQMMKENRLSDDQLDARMRAVEELRAPTSSGGIDFGRLKNLMFWKRSK